MRRSSFIDFLPWKLSKPQKDVKSWLQQWRKRTGLNLRSKLTMLGFVVNIFVTGAKSDDPLHTDYIPTVFAFVPVAGALRKRKSIDWYGRSQKRARNQDEKKKKKTPSNNETAIYVNVEDEHSVPETNRIWNSSR